MTSLSDTLMSAVGLFGLSLAAGSTPRPAPEAQPLRDFVPELLPLVVSEKNLPPDAAEADDPFFLAIADALREAGYLDS